MSSAALASAALSFATGVVLATTWSLRKRIQIGEDFALARRRLPAYLTGISQAINCVPAWLLLALSFMAYSKGLAAVWMALAVMIGLIVNWWLVAPLLRTHTATARTDTLSQWFAASAGESLQTATLRSATAIVVLALGFASLTSLQWAAEYVATLLECSFATALLLLAVILLSVTFFGGVWSASVGDVLQAGLVLFVMLVVIAGSLVAVGGWHGLLSGVLAREPIAGSWFGGYTGVLAIAMLVGSLFAAFSSAAQPQAISRYLACRDDATLRRARWIALVWPALALLGALLIGWCARIVSRGAVDGRSVLFALIDRVVPSGMMGGVVACIAIVFALACASPWVALAAHVGVDLRSGTTTLSLRWARAALSIIVAIIVLAAFYLPIGGEDRLWLCWQSVGAAFGPLLLVRLTGKKVRAGSSLGAMWSGCILTLLFHLMPDTPGDLLERSLPFIAAMGIALSGGERRRNPDRADRGDKTIHDHLPI